jgi:hypothetical protein
MINEMIRRPPNAVVLGLQAPMLFHIFLDKSRWQKWSVVFKPTTRHVLLKMGEAMIECYKSSSSSSSAASFLLPNNVMGEALIECHKSSSSAVFPFLEESCSLNYQC